MDEAQMSAEQAEAICRRLTEREEAEVALARDNPNPDPDPGEE